MFKQAALVMWVIFVVASWALAQNNRFDVALGANGAFSSQASGNGTTLEPTNSLGFLVAGRYRFSSKFSVAVNYDRFRNSQIYDVAPNVYRVPSKVSEYTGVIVITPKETEKWEPFFDVGVGFLRFYPDYFGTEINGFQVPVNVFNQNRIAVVYGGGVDRNIISHVALRLQYRGVVFQAPDLQGPQGFFTGAKQHIAEPALSVVFKF